MLIFRKLFKAVVWLLAVFVLFGLGILLAAKYVLPSHLEQWRPDIEQWVQQKTQMPFQAGHMDVQWQQLVPQLRLNDVVIGDNQHHPIRIQELTVALNPASLLNLNPKASLFSVHGLNIQIMRNEAGEISILDKVLNTEGDRLVAHLPEYDEQIKKSVSDWLAWAFNQLPNNVHIEDARIEWQDHAIATRPKLVFDPVDVTVQHDGQHMTVQISISPVKQTDSVLRFQADFIKEGNGQVDISWQNWRPQYFKEWLHFPLEMRQGVIQKAEGKFVFEHHALKSFNVQTVLNDFVFLEKEPQDDNAVVVQGDLADLTISSQTGIHHPYHFDIKAQKLYAQVEDYFRHPVDFSDIHMRGTYDLNAQQSTRLYFDEFTTHLPHGELRLKGSWEVDPHSDNGIVDLQGQIPYIALNKLPDYLPKTINAESLDWLENAFLNGTVENATVRIKGVVDHIPFGIYHEDGDFRIQGQVKDMTLHYHQYADGDEYWPDIIVPSAEVDFNRQDIVIKGQNFQLESALGTQGLRIPQAEVSVNHIEKNSSVDIQAELSLTGEELLAFYQQSPLQRILSNVLNKTVMTGSLTGPINVHIPILDTDASTVDGHFVATQMAFQLSPDYPMLTEANGTIRVSERNVQLDNVVGQLLGGQATLDGFIGANGDVFSVKGVLTQQGLYDYLLLPGVERRVKGSTEYTADVHFLDKGRVDAVLQSDLKGISLDLPAALSKQAAQATPVHIHLAPLSPDASMDKLTLTYKNLGVQLERNRQHSSAFQRGVVSLNRSDATMPDKGLKVVLQDKRVDINEWLEVVNDFSDENAQESGIFPPTKWLNIDANRLLFHGAYLDKASVQGQRNGQSWLLNVQSPQAEGSITLHMGKNDVDEVGLSLNKFVLRQEDDDKPEQQKDDKNKQHQARRIDLPSIKGQIKQFFLRDQLLGQLTIDSQRQNKNVWQLHSLGLSSDVGNLYATGQFKSEGNRTKGDIKLNINALNTGDFLQHFGYAKDLKAGKGFINAHLLSDDVSAWDLAHLEMTGQMQVNKGALLQVNTNAMKFLSLVSLQSFSGLGSLTGASPSVFSKGLPFDYMRSSFTLKKALLDLHDFRLNGPLVALVAAGKTHLQDETLRFEVAAIPKIEMSGAAVLAGVIVNPVVGVGAFLSQWLLTAPLNRALTAFFDVSGTWDNPEIKSKSLPKEEELKSNSNNK